MPVTANVKFLVWFLGNFSDFWMAVNMSKKPINIDFAPAPRKAQMRFRAKVLITKKQHPVLSKCRLKRLHLSVAHVIQIYISNQCSHRTCRFNLNILSHITLPRLT